MDLVLTMPMLLFDMATARVSSLLLRAMPKIWCFLVAAGYHLAIKSYACLPEEDWFSSWRIHMAISPSLEPMKKPLEKVLMLTTYDWFSSEKA